MFGIDLGDVALYASGVLTGWLIVKQPALITAMYDKAVEKIQSL